MEAITPAAELNGTFYAMRILSEGLQLSELDVVTEVDEYPGTEFSVDEQSFALALLGRIQSSEESPLHALSQTARNEYISRLAERVERLASEELFNAGMIEADDVSGDTVLPTTPSVTEVRFGLSSHEYHLRALHLSNRILRANIFSGPASYLPMHSEPVWLRASTFFVARFLGSGFVPAVKTSDDTEMQLEELSLSPYGLTRMTIRNRQTAFMTSGVKFYGGSEPGILPSRREAVETFLHKLHGEQSGYFIADPVDTDPDSTVPYAGDLFARALEMLNQTFLRFNFPPPRSPEAEEFQLRIIDQLVEHILEAAKRLGVSPDILLRYLQSR